MGKSYNDAMSARRRDEPMSVKYWSFAGLMLTYWCNARCASCYLRCSPGHDERMDAGFALRIWRELIDACPHGCRIHLTGGEAFGDWGSLIELARRAQGEQLRPLEKIETNAFWATDRQIVRRRLAALDEAGMVKLVISADPYHQQFVPIARCRLLAKEAMELLGAQRVQVRWRDWLAGGCDTDALPADERESLFLHYAASGRDRMTGRATDTLAGRLAAHPAEAFEGSSCRDALLRSRHVHVGPDGLVMPGACAGIVLGRALDESISSIWRRLENDFDGRPIVGVLSRKGPAGLLDEAQAAGFRPSPDGYASKCHLCWSLRKFFAGFAGEKRFTNEIAPVWLYA